VQIHWYIMTSPFTDEVTRKFFETHRYFGLEPNQVRIITCFFVVIRDSLTSIHDFLNITIRITADFILVFAGDIFPTGYYSMCIS
jgi:hypothetical protein